MNEKLGTGRENISDESTCSYVELIQSQFELGLHWKQILAPGWSVTVSESIEEVTLNSVLFLCANI